MPTQSLRSSEGPVRRWSRLFRYEAVYDPLYPAIGFLAVSLAMAVLEPTHARLAEGFIAGALGLNVRVLRDLRQKR